MPALDTKSAEQLLDLRAPAAADRGLLVGAGHHHGRAAQGSRDEVEQRERFTVGGVQIVDHDEERVACADVPEERRDRVEEREPRLLRAQRPKRLDPGHTLAQLGKDLCDPVRTSAELALNGGGVATVDERAKRLRPRPVGGRPRILPAAAPDREHPPGFGELA